MFTVALLINGNPIIARSAVNRGPCKTDPTYHSYELDDGQWVKHKRSEGAVKLAQKILKTIKEQKTIETRDVTNII